MDRPKGEAVPSAKLNEAAVRHIRAEGRNYRERLPFMTVEQLAEMYDVSSATIVRARSRKFWKHVE